MKSIRCHIVSGMSFEFFQKSSLNSMNSLKMFHGYVNVVIYGNLTIINLFFMVTLLLSINFDGKLTIINKFLW